VPRPRAEEHGKITRVRLPFHLKILHRNTAPRQWAAEHVPFKRIPGPERSRRRAVPCLAGLVQQDGSELAADGGLTQT
jgi:hypothetical protein